MSGRSWVCRCCGEELGIVERGALYPKPTTPTRLESVGGAWITCTRCATGQCGRRGTERCKGGREWTPHSPQTALTLVR